MTIMAMALASFFAVSSLNSNSGSWTSRFDSEMKVFSSTEDLGFLPISFEIVPKGGIKIQYGNVTRIVNERFEVTRFAGLMQNNDLDCITVVFETKDGAVFSYRWISFSLNRKTLSLSERASGDIVLATDQLNPIALSIFENNLTVDMKETQEVVGNRSSLLLRFSHRCLANGVTGVLERHYVLADELEPWISKIKDAYPRDYGLRK